MVGRLVAAFICLVLLIAPVHAAKRVALVIGNDAYVNVAALRKAANDAGAVADALQRIGFVVQRSIDADRKSFAKAMADFESSIEPGDTALFYFAGHGVAIDGGNYLVPTDIAPITDGQKTLVRSESFLTDDIAAMMKERGAAQTILVLDACRNNPFSKTTRAVGETRGLARANEEPGMFYLFSAGPGQTALDALNSADTDPNSVFTRVLLKLITRNDLSLIDIAKTLHGDVKQLAASVGHEQTPGYYDQIEGYLFLARGEVVAATASGLPSPSSVAPIVKPTPSPAAEPKPVSSEISRATGYRVVSTVSDGVLNMRTGPGKQFELVTAIPAGEDGLAMGRCVMPEDPTARNPWCAVTWRGVAGWVSSCCIVSAVTGAYPQMASYRVRESVSDGFLNLREGPGKSYSVILEVPAGTGPFRLGRCGPSPDNGRPWCRVRWNGFDGWMAASGLEDGAGQSPTLQ